MPYGHDRPDVMSAAPYHNRSREALDRITEHHELRIVTVRHPEGGDNYRVYCPCGWSKLILSNMYSDDGINNEYREHLPA